MPYKSTKQIDFNYFCLFEPIIVLDFLDLLNDVRKEVIDFMTVISYPYLCWFAHIFAHMHEEDIFGEVFIRDIALLAEGLELFKEICGCDVGDL